MDSVVHVFDRLCSYNIFSFLCKCFQSWVASWITQTLAGNDPTRQRGVHQRRVIGQNGRRPNEAKQVRIMIIGFEDVCASVLRVIYIVRRKPHHPHVGKLHGQWVARY